MKRTQYTILSGFVPKPRKRGAKPADDDGDIEIAIAMLKCDGASLNSVVVKLAARKHPDDERKFSEKREAYCKRLTRKIKRDERYMRLRPVIT